MSGGGNKKKPLKTQGWEEAGSEFYQESYPTDAEFEILQKDANPKHLATLLPSKKTRAAATIRLRTIDSRSTRRNKLQTLRSRRDSTAPRRASIAGDVQVSMLPDLSQPLSNEQTIWEQIMDIKAMPIPMAAKKDMKSKLLNEPNLRLQGYEQLNWKRRKLWRQFRLAVTEFNTKWELWKNSLKNIEGQFGTGVVAYFLFLKYLLFLNTFIFLVIFLFIILPTAFHSDEGVQKNETCDNNSNVVLDFIQGTGFMKHTSLYYGFYPNSIFNLTMNSSTLYYNLPLAYISITILYFLVSLFSIVKSATNGFKERLIEGEGQFYRYCNIVFGGWDFCIHSEKSAAIKHQAIFNDIRVSLETERLEEIKHNRSRNENIKLLLTRILVNILVLATLAACGYAIFLVFHLSKDKVTPVDDYFLQFVFEFLPSLTIVASNVLLPFVFHYLVTFEKYSPTFVIRITLARTVLLRLASIFMLYASVADMMDEEKPPCPCWEVMAGQQIYKLIITDFASNIFLTFFVNFPRSFLARHVKNNFIKLIGEQSFDLPKHVLDVVYLQTLCWIGCFYAPLISFIVMMMFIFVFYIKKFACLINCNPSSVIYRASRSNSMFMIVLLISFMAAAIPLAYSFSEVRPSINCGPFRNTSSVWYQVESLFYTTPAWLQKVITFLTTAGFAVPIFLLLILLLYYYKAINSANRQMVSVLKNQLVLEGHDKQFLLERLSKFIKQQQDYHKKMRPVDILHGDGTNMSSN